VPPSDQGHREVKGVMSGFTFETMHIFCGLHPFNLTNQKPWF